MVPSPQGSPRSFDKYGTWLVSQAFPMGSPVHRSYPTGLRRRSDIDMSILIATLLVEI